MKKMISAFILRGLVAGGFGPIVLAVVYLILNRAANIEILTVSQLCRGTFSMYLLAFVAGGMNVIYSIERLPLMASILIHGGVLYGCYLATYLLNDWLDFGAMPITVFSGIFVLGFVAVWVVIYSINRKNTKRVNEKLRNMQTLE